jgi:hypothetical protein
MACLPELLFYALGAGVLISLIGSTLGLLIVQAVCILLGIGGFVRARLLGRPFGEHDNWAGWVWDGLVGLLVVFLAATVFRAF